jgi:hypothetical protein
VGDRDGVTCRREASGRADGRDDAARGRGRNDDVRDAAPDRRRRDVGHAWRCGLHAQTGGALGQRDRRQVARIGTEDSPREQEHSRQNRQQQCPRRRLSPSRSHGFPRSGRQRS